MKSSRLSTMKQSRDHHDEGYVTPEALEPEMWELFRPDTIYVGPVRRWRLTNPDGSHTVAPQDSGASTRLWEAFPIANYTREQHLAFGEVAEALRALRIRAIRNTKRSR